MLLSPGTTLHHDTYVIDALLEEAEDGALYWGTRQGTPVYIQAKLLKPEPNAAPTLNLLQHRSSPQPPCLTGVLDTFTEAQSQYWVLAHEAGQPWSHWARYGGPLPVKQALIKLRQASEGLTWLVAQGIHDIALSPKYIWWRDLDSPLVLTGWSAPSVLASADDADDFNPQRDLATLLWQFLSGQVAPAPTTASELQHQLPQVSPQLLKGIRLGLEASPPPRVELPATLAAWLQSLLLPDPDGYLMHSQPEPFNVDWVAPQRKPSPVPALTLTALIAALVGIGGGMAWRFASGSETSGTAQFSPDQGFPALSNWSGDSPEPRRELAVPPLDDRGLPTELLQDNGLIQPGYLDIPDRWADPVDNWEPSGAAVRPQSNRSEPNLPPRSLDRPVTPPASPLPTSPALGGEPETTPETTPSMVAPVPELNSPEPAPLEAAPAPKSNLSKVTS